MLRILLIALSRITWMKHFMVAFPLARRVARRFVAGEKLDDAVRAVERLLAGGLETTLDLLGENVHTPEATRRVVEEYCTILAALRQRGLKSHISLKLTQLGLDQGEEICQENLEAIVAEAARDEIFVRVDMESSDYTERTLRVVERARQKYDNVGVVIQSYLHRSRQDIARAKELGLRVRLCKGAYAEPPSVAYQRKEEVDANFIRLTEDLLSEGRYPALATHDERMVRAAIDFARSHGISPEAFEFQMLYGIRRERQLELRQEGYNVRVYVPFGTEWYPYFMRRLAEKPANLVFFLTALVRG